MQVKTLAQHKDSLFGKSLDTSCAALSEDEI